MHNNNHKRQETTIFPLGNHKGEIPATSSEIEWAPNRKSKTQEYKDGIQQLFSLSLMRYCWVSVCIKIESLTLYLYLIYNWKVSYRE